VAITFLRLIFAKSLRWGVGVRVGVARRAERASAGEGGAYYALLL